MPDVQKYRNTMNLGREDDNFLGWKLGDIVHTAGSYVKANRYNYCGYEPFDIPTGSRVRIIGIKQTDLNKSLHNACTTPWVAQGVWSQIVFVGLCKICARTCSYLYLLVVVRICTKNTGTPPAQPTAQPIAQHLS